MSYLFSQDELEETDFKNLLSDEDLRKLDLPPHLFPQIYRGVPRTCFHQDLSLMTTKKPFRNTVLLKKQVLEKALFSLYRSFPLPEKTRIALLCTIYWDGLGDFYAGVEAAKILKDRFPDLNLTFITLKRKGQEIPPLSFLHHDLTFEIDDKKVLIYEPFPHLVMKKIKASCLILEFPTYYTPTPKLLEALKTPPPHEVIGEAGFLNHEHFSPEKGYRCMGLHFLEKGILIKQPPSKQQNPTPYYLAYTRTAEGLELYLHALLKWKESETDSLMIYIFKLQYLLKILQEKSTLTFFSRYGIARVEVETGKYSSHIELQPKGKTIRFRFFDHVDNKAFLSLLATSEDFVACTGDSSLFEAISLNKIFFYDMPEHKADLIHDLIALAKVRTPHCKDFLSCFLPGQRRGEIMCSLLKDSKISNALHQLNIIIQKEYAINDFIGDLVLRHTLHHHFPALKKKEAEFFELFARGTINAYEFLTKVKNHLGSTICMKN